MPVLDLTDPAAVERYSTFVRSHPHRSLTQDLRWGVVKDDWGQEAVYLEEDGQIVAAMTILVRRLPGGFSILYAPRGPLVDWDDKTLVRRILAEAGPLVKKHRAIMTRIDPEVRFDAGLDTWLRTQPGWVVKNVGAGSDEIIQPRYIMVVQLQDEQGMPLSEEDLFAKYAPRARSRVRAGLRKGVEVTFEDSAESLELFHEVYAQMARRKEITSRNLAYFERMKEAFGEAMTVAVARHEDDVLAVAVLIDYHGRITYLYAGSTEVKRKLDGAWVLNHVAMVEGAQRGAESYDFGGVFALDDSDGLYTFKRAFTRGDGGATELIGEVDVVHNKVLYAAIATGLPRLQYARRWTSAKISQLRKRRTAQEAS